MAVRGRQSGGGFGTTAPFQAPDSDPPLTLATSPSSSSSPASSPCRTPLSRKLSSVKPASSRSSSMRQPPGLSSSSLRGIDEHSQVVEGKGVRGGGGYPVEQGAQVLQSLAQGAIRREHLWDLTPSLGLAEERCDGHGGRLSLSVPHSSRRRLHEGALSASHETRDNPAAFEDHGLFVFPPRNKAPVTGIVFPNDAAKGGPWTRPKKKVLPHGELVHPAGLQPAAPCGMDPEKVPPRKPSKRRVDRVLLTTAGTPEGSGGGRGRGL
jgi:hypothetical protein